MAILSGDIKLDLIGLLVAIIAVVYVYYKWAFQYWSRKGIPYVKGTIPYGSFVSPYKRTIGNQYADFYNYAKEKGKSDCNYWILTSQIEFTVKSIFYQL